MKFILNTHKQNFLFLFMFIFLFGIANCQAPLIRWDYNFGGSDNDYLRMLRLTKDGGFITVGFAGSHDHDITTSHGATDAWVLKLDSIGNKQWQTCFGGTGSDNCRDICYSPQNNYVFCGETNTANNGNVSGLHGGSDCWVVGLDSTGLFQWQKCLGGGGNEFPSAIIPAHSNGYLMSATTYSHDFDVVGNHSNPFYSDCWIVKLDPSGNILWQTCLGGTVDDECWSMSKTLDSGIIICGMTRSNDGNVSGNHGGSDAWVAKLDSSGNLIWQKCLGGTGDEFATYIQPTPDSGFVFTGFTNSNDGDVSGNHGSDDLWVCKLDASGNLLWQKCYGGTNQDDGDFISLDTDSGFVVSGYSLSNDGDLTQNNGSADYWVLKTDPSGTLLWQISFGGSNNDFANTGYPTGNGEYIIAGQASSNDFDVTRNYGIGDYWIVKLKPASGTGILASSNDLEKIDLFPNPANDFLMVTGSKINTENHYEIYNCQGNILQEGSWHSSNNKIDLQNFTNGIYFLNIVGVGTKKIAIAR